MHSTTPRLATMCWVCSAPDSPPKRCPIPDLDPVWDLAQDHELKAVFDCALPEVRPEAEALADGPPLPPTARAFVERPCYRPPGSFRCFYLCLHWPADGVRPGGVLAVK